MQKKGGKRKDDDEEKKTKKEDKNELRPLYLYSFLPHITRLSTQFSFYLFNFILFHSLRLSSILDSSDVSLGQKKTSSSGNDIVDSITQENDIFSDRKRITVDIDYSDGLISR